MVMMQLRRMFLRLASATTGFFDRLGSAVGIVIAKVAPQCAPGL
jgi:hypothetical protein